MATLADVLTHARKSASTDSNGLSDADGIIMANDALDEIWDQIIVDRETLFLTEAYRSIGAAQIKGGANPGQFLFPTDMYYLKSIEYNPTDPTQQSLFLQCILLDFSNTPQNVSFEWLRANQQITQPMIQINGDWYEIVPTPLVTSTNSIRLLYWPQPTYFVATTDTITYPFTLNYKVLGYRVAAFYLRQQKDFDGAKEMTSKSDDAMKRLLNALKQQVETPIQAKPLGISGYQF